MNPYESPSFRPTSPSEWMPQPNRGLVNHVRVVAILMMVQAGLEVVMGLFLVVMAVVVPFVFMEGIEQDANFQQGPFGPDTFRWFMVAMYGGMGAAHLLVGALHGYAGFRNYRFQSRNLGIVALASGFATVLGCYCLPTAFALTIYGLIVYLNGPVAAAFELREQGHSAGEVLAAFNR